MNTLLVDLQVGGHHVEYASHLLNELQGIGVNPKMLGAEPDERYEELFDPSQIDYIYEKGRDFATDLDREPQEARRAFLRRVRERADSTYDTVHFLHIDDIIEECYRELRQWDSPPIVGSLNGAFFRARAFGEAPLTLIADRLFHPRVADLLPVRSNGSTLYRCLRDGVFDHLLVPTEAAQTSLERYVPNPDKMLTVVPDPVGPWYNKLPPQERACRHLDLPTTRPILLFFGQMRAEKGINLLVNALELYEGPEFTMVLVGSPTDVNRIDLESIENSVVDLYARTEFVPEADVTRYFAAADGAVLPYRRSFGESRPSGVFQKACASHLPIVAPNFGFFKQRIESHNLGVTFKAGDASSLAKTLVTAVKTVTTGVDERKFDQYVATQTYRKLAEETASVYNIATS